MKIPNSLSSRFGRQTLILQKHSPHLLFGAGVVGVVGTAVLASKATLQLSDYLDETNDLLQKVQDHPDPKYTDELRKKDTTKIYVRRALGVGRLYFPAVSLGVLSVAALTGSHVILTKRNAGLTAAYALLDKGFDEYRDRVIEKFGEEQDEEFRYDIKEVKVKAKDGVPAHTVKVRQGGPSMYAELFDERSSSWSPDEGYNDVFLRVQQGYANDRLAATGHLLLNDVLDGLGLPRTSEGAVVGWVWGKNGADNYVDFGLDKFADYIGLPDEHEQVRLLDFNVDGVVYQLIGKEGQ